MKQIDKFSSFGFPLRALRPLRETSFSRRVRKARRGNPKKSIKESTPTLHENELSRIIVDCAFRVHNTLGPGLLENVYRAALAYELTKRDLRVAIERPIPAVYEDVRLELGFRADIIVENKVIVETKSIEALAPIHGKILLTYLRLADVKLGLLINFNVDLIKDGIRRVVNNL